MLQNLFDQLIEQIVNQNSPEFLNQDIRAFKEKMYKAIDDIISLDFFKFEDDPSMIWIGKFFERLETENQKFIQLIRLFIQIRKRMAKIKSNSFRDILKVYHIEILQN